MRYIKLSQYIMTFFLFLLTGALTLYYGKETFHFVLIPEELDNDYWRLVEQGAKDAAKFHNVYHEYLVQSRPTMTNT